MCFGLRVQRRIGKQLVGQGLDAEFAGNLALGAALGLVGQVQVFQFLLGGRGFDGGTQLGRQLALLVDALEHGGAAVGQFAQIGQAGFQFAQLRIVQATRGLLAVTGDERDGGATIEKLNCCLNLTRQYLDFTGDLFDDALHCGNPLART